MKHKIEKTKQELLAYRMPTTKIIENNTIADIAALNLPSKGVLRNKGARRDRNPWFWAQRIRITIKGQEMSKNKNEKSTDLATQLGELEPRVREMLASPENDVFKQGVEFLRAHDASTEEVLQFLGLELDVVHIPKGEFSFQDKIRVLVNEFRMWRTPITEAQWAAVMPHWEDAKPGSDLPQARISWDDIQLFLERLNIILSEDGLVADLPHEVEWEYAARAGQNFKYSGSDDPDEVAWYGANSGGHTHPVGLKKPNGWGLYDMSGNVWEWCKNVYHEEIEKVIEDFKAMLKLR